MTSNLWGRDKTGKAALFMLGCPQDEMEDAVARARAAGWTELIWGMTEREPDGPPSAEIPTESPEPARQRTRKPPVLPKRKQPEKPKIRKRDPARQKTRG